MSYIDIDTRAMGQYQFVCAASSAAAIDATNNDWGTSDTSTIESMIYDNHVDITTAGSIPYEPTLSGPDPSTPAGEFFSTQAPAISGRLTVGSTLTTSAGSWGPTQGATVTYQWADNGTPIPGATGTTYILTPGDLGDQVTVAVTVSEANYTTATFTSLATAPITAGRLVNTSAPTVSGTVRVGSTVRATPGDWTPTGATFSYQWLANGRPVSGATDSSLTIPASLARQQLTVKVTASQAGYADATATSAVTVVSPLGRSRAPPRRLSRGPCGSG